MGKRLLNRKLGDARHLVGRLDHLLKHADVVEDFRKIDFLEVPGSRLASRNLTRDGQHRSTFLLGIVEAIE